MRTLSPTTTLPALAALAVFALSGCTAAHTRTAHPAHTSSPSAARSTQTKAEACELMATAFTSLSSLSDPASLKATLGDPIRAKEALQTMNSTIQSAAKEVTNPTVKPGATRAAAAIATYTKRIEAIAADPTATSESNIGVDVKEFSAGIAPLSKTCSTASEG